MEVQSQVRKAAPQVSGTSERHPGLLHPGGSHEACEAPGSDTVLFHRLTLGVSEQ